MSDEIKQIGLENNLASDYNDILLSTLESLPNCDIIAHHGMVEGVMIISRNPLKEWLSGWRNYFGKNELGLLGEIHQARQEAIKKMVQSAKQLDANAIAGIRFDNITIAFAAIEVRVYGAAMKISSYS